VSVGVFAPLALLSIAVFIVGDVELFKIVNQGLISPTLDFACVYLSPILFSFSYVLVVVALYLALNVLSKATAILSIANGVLSYGVGSLIKMLIERPRPEVLAAARVIAEARIIGLWHTSTFSFPSTLTMLAFGLSLPILLQKRRSGVILVALSYFMGFAVIYTGFHFPLDVAAGIFFSLGLTFCTSLLRNPLARYLEARRLLNRRQGKNSIL